MLKVLNCEDELIHLCGRIQNFGYLIVFDENLNCIAISENCIEWLPIDISYATNKHINYFLQYISTKVTIHIKVEDFITLTDRPVLYQTKLNDINYTLTCYVINSQLFFEFEKNEEMNINIHRLLNLQTTFMHSENTWQAVCENIYNVVEFDRIMVYKFSEDGSGIVVAEKTNLTKDLLIGYRYPEFDIPIQARTLYLKNHSRQCPDIYADTPKILGLQANEIDLSKSQIRAISPKHIQYLKNFGVRASASFSIIIDDRLWGLVTCLHLTPKYITFDQRSLCLLITQYAVNTFLIKKHQTNLKKNLSIGHIKLELKEKLFYNQSLEKTLSEFSQPFMETLSATGFAIKTPDQTVHFGNTPADDTLDIIHQKINELAGSDDFYASHSFQLNDSNVDNSNWTGIARISFDKDHENVAYWFRKEILVEEKWAGVPEKISIYSEEQKAYMYSPRTSFQAWTREVKGQSEKWSRFDIKFLKSIHQLIQDSLLRKMTEIKRLNEKLIETNNKLETYTHQLGHDLKNPLSVIKTSAQFVKTHTDLPQNLLSKFSTSIVESANLMNDIIDKTIESTDSNPSLLYFEPISPDTFIKQIINQAIENYNIQYPKIIIGDLLPIFGERTLLYQLFMNLINNAIKFSSKQEITIFEIYSEIIENKTVYYIKDNGIGIAEDERIHIFSIFKRLQNANEYEGTGVGMSIVKRIVNKLNASIDFKSQVGIGTTFKITFPNE